MQTYVVAMYGWSEPLLVKATAVRSERGDLVFTVNGLATFLVAAGRWTTCEVQDDAH